MLSKRYDSTEVDRRTWLHVFFKIFSLCCSDVSDLHNILDIINRTIAMQPWAEDSELKIMKVEGGRICMDSLIYNLM